MANLQQLSEATEKLLSNPAARATLKLNSYTRERAFESYVFSLLVRAVVRAGGDVTIRGISSGPHPNPVVFRGGPGHMSSRAQDFAFAECELNGRSFEIHLGVQYVGTSGALHEADVSMFDSDQAERVRRDRVVPTTRSLRAALECKFYDSALGVHLGRTFVGLLSDFGGLKIKGFVSNGRSLALADYFSRSDRPQPFFALSPLRRAVADRFVNTVEQDLRKWCCVCR